MHLYHALNRGVDKRSIFLDDRDCLRFTHGLDIFNDVKPVENLVYFFSKTTQSVESIDLRGRYRKKDANQKPKKRLVEVHGWCLMGNHYHLLLSALVDGGVSKFLMKLNVGYAKYFNLRHERVGTLFQGRTKKVLIANDAQFLHILHYIHLNPLDLLTGAEGWRGLEIRNTSDAMKQLDAYRWSSYLDYCGKKNFTSIITTELFGDVFRNYKRTIATYLKDIEVEPIRDLLLE